MRLRNSVEAQPAHFPKACQKVGTSAVLVDLVSTHRLPAVYEEVPAFQGLSCLGFFAAGVLVFTEVVERPQEVMVAGREIIPESGATEFFVPLEDLICQDEMTTALRTNKPVPPCVPPAGVERTRIGVEDKLFKITVANVGECGGPLSRCGPRTRVSLRSPGERVSDASFCLSTCSAA